MKFYLDFSDLNIEGEEGTDNRILLLLLVLNGDDY
jgi:hypothetical protein